MNNADLRLYALVDYAHINSKFFDIQIDADIFIIECNLIGIEDPKIEPIGIFSLFGDEILIWDDRYFKRYNVDWRNMITRIDAYMPTINDTNSIIYFKKLRNLLFEYGRPTPFPPLTNRFVKVIYEYEAESV